MSLRWSPLKIIVASLFLAGLLFVLLPLLHLFWSVSSKEMLAIIGDGEVWQAIRVSFEAALLATLCGLFLGTPAGWLLARHEFRCKALLEGFFNLPIVIPHVAVGIILLNLLNPNAPLGRFFGAFHLSFVDTLYGIVVAMCFVSFSYLVSAALMGFRAVGPELEFSARTLGASPWFTFRQVTFPLVFPYLLRGAILAFARAVSEVGALLILACYPRTAPLLLYERFENYGLGEARSITALLIVLSLFLFTALVIISQRLGQKNAS